MELVEAFVQFKADTKQFDTAVGSVKKQLDGLKGNFDAVQAFARKTFFAIAAFAGFSVKAFGDAEAEAEGLRSALRNTFEQTIANRNATDDYAASLDNLNAKTIAGQVSKTISRKPDGAAISSNAQTIKLNYDGSNIDAAIDATMERLNKFASAMQQLTVYDDDAIAGAMKLALNLGVAAKDIEQVTRTGIGLGQKFFGGDLKAGMEAAAKAYNGNSRALDRIIPGLKLAGSAQEKWNIIQKQGAGGFQQAEARTRSFNGAMLQLWGQLGNVAEQIGGVMAPAVVRVSGYINALAQRFQSLSTEQTQQIVKWGLMAGGVAAFIAFGPKILSFAGTVASAFVSMAKVGATAIAFLVQSFASGAVFLVTTPIGLILGGLAALATGFAYLIGSGDTFASRTIDGFMKIVSFLDTMLGSWEGFTASMNTIWSQGGWMIADVWVGVQTYLLNQWEALKFAFKAIFYAFGSTIAEWATRTMGVFRSVISYVSNAWESMINYLSNKMAAFLIKRQVDVDIRARNEGKNTSEEDIQKQIAAETNIRLAALASMNNKIEAEKERAYQAEQKAIRDKTDATVRAIEQWGQKGTEAAANDLVNNERKNNAEGAASSAYAKATQQKQLADDLAKLSKMPKLSDKIKEAYDMIKAGLGLDSIQKFVDGIKGEVDRVRGDADKAQRDAQGEYGKGKGIGLGSYGEAADSANGKTIEQSFKENVTKQMVGAVRLNQEEQSRKSEEAEKKKQAAEALKAQREATAAHKRQEEALKKNTEALNNRSGNGTATAVAG